MLDFGLAKALESLDLHAAGAPVDSPTITSPALTVRGVILGTAAYMAPEQAKGKPVDRRADIWAFGCVLYEMLTGQRAFGGDDITDTLTAVLRDEPDWAALPAETPAHLRALLRRSVVKDPEAAAARHRGRAADAAGSGRPGRHPASNARASPAPPLVAWLTASLVLGALSFVAARLTAPASHLPAEVRFEVPTPAANPINFAISPDGRRLAFVGGGQLWIRDMEALDARAVPGIEGVRNPAWSPSGRWIAFTQSPENRLVRVGVDGGAPEAIAQRAAGRPAWTSETELVFTHNDTARLHRVPAAGGTPQPIFTADASTTDRQSWPAVLPGSDQVLFLSEPQGRAPRELRVGSVAAGTSRSVVRSDSMGVFAGRSTLLFIRNNALFAQPFDPRRVKIAGDPVQVSGDVTFNAQNGRGGFNASSNGTVVLRPGGDVGASWNLRVLSRNGDLVKTFADATQPLGPAISPDGRRVAFHRLENGGGDLWTLNLSDSVQRRFTFDRVQENASPVWSPDGGRIVLRSRRGTNWALVEKRADGAGAETSFAEFPHPVSPMSWSADGTHLLFMLIDPVTNWDIWQYSFADRRASPLVNTPETEGFPRFSPDGRWVANSVHTTTTVQLFVESFPGGRGKWQVPSEMAHYPRWRADGRELFFLRQPSDQSLLWTALAVDVRGAGAGLEFGPPRRLFDAPGIYGGVAGYSGNYIAWATSGDGQRFFLQQPPEAADGR